MHGSHGSLWIAVCIATSVAIAAPARAALVLTVDSEDDFPDAVPGDGRCAAAGGDCTLRAAVQEANARPGADAIVLPRGGYRIALAGGGEDAAATGDLDLTDDVTITGEGVDLSAIDGGGLDGVLHVLPGVRAELRGLTISGGLQAGLSGGAGGIFNQGVLRLVDSAVNANAAAIPYGTGGLMNAGVATIERTQFELDSPTAITNTGTLTLSHTLLYANGPVAAIDTEEGSLTLISSEIAEQRGTALYCQGGPTRIDRSWIHGTRPGAAMLVPGGAITILDSIIEDNAGGGIDNDGALRIERSTLRANSPPDGDGNAGSTAGLAGVAPYTAVTNTNGTVIIDSLILDHRGGGLVNEEGGMTLVNVTLSGNSARLGGGAISNYATLEVRNSTITANASSDGSGSGGIATDADASMFISNSIVAGNSGADGAAADCRGPITSEGYNLIGDGAGCDELTSAAGDRVGADPKLGPLADNGGPTLTHALLPGSAAIDGGNPAAPGSVPAACPSTDQRGAGRPQGAACDIGAFETTPLCGDGRLDAGEACDDGNTADGDCCSALCALAPLPGDCNGDGAVAIDELLAAVNLALELPDAPECRAADADADGAVGIGDLLHAVLSAIDGCVPPG